MKILREIMKVKKMAKMKKGKLILLSSLFLLFSCNSSGSLKLRIEVSEVPSLNIDQFQEIGITNFMIKEDTKDFNLNDELKDYFSSELVRNFEKKINMRDITVDNDKLFEDEEYWQDISSGSTHAVLITGSVRYNQEIRKALIEEEKTRHNDPFSSKTELAQRTFYTLQLDLYLINSQSGETIYKNSFKETKKYKNPNQTAHFAFFDLIQIVKEKLFYDLLGRERVQERYLIKQIE